NLLIPESSHSLTTPAQQALAMHPHDILPPFPAGRRMQFSTIGIISRRDNRDIIDSLTSLTAFLEKQPGLSIVVDDNVSALLDPHPFRVCAREKMGELCELVIVVGGDGSMLKAAPVLAEQNLPVVGINRGRLGFLTDILPDDIETRLGPILS